MLGKVVILVTLHLCLVQGLWGQKISLIDPSQTGAILYNKADFKGDSIQIFKIGASVRPDFTVESIRILGNYEVKTSRKMVIKEDLEKVRMTLQDFTLEMGNDPRVAIAYTQPNYKGRAIYLKAYEVLGKEVCKSIKIGAGHRGNLVNQQGKLIELCSSVSELTNSEFELQIIPGICR